VAILHVDDQEAIREIVRRALEACGLAVVSADGVRSAERALMVRDGSGLEVYRWIAQHRPALATRVAFVTGSADTEVVGPLVTLGCRVIRKPFELADLWRLTAEWETAVASGPFAQAPRG
jgi:CheY-like chemotaxis protein